MEKQRESKMSMKDAIIEFLLDNVRVPISTLEAVLDSLDADEDGYISLREVYERVTKS